MTDEERIDRLHRNEGSEEDETWFHQHYLPVVRSTALALTRNADDADEVRQRTFIIAFRRIDRFDRARGPIEPWLRGIARKVTYQLFDGRTRDRRLADRLMLHCPACQAGPEEIWLGKCRRRRLTERLATLPPKRAHIAIRHGGEGATYEQLKQETGQSVRHNRHEYAATLAELRKLYRVGRAERRLATG